MIDFGFARSRWTVFLALTVGSVGLTGMPVMRGLGFVYPLTALLLLVAAALWYWKLEARMQPEPLPKLRVGGLAVLLLLLALLYALLVAALQLPDALAGLASGLLLGVVAVAVAAALAVAVDLALRSRQAWSRIFVAASMAALGFDLLQPALGGLGLPPVAWAIWAAALLFGVVAVAAPLEWVVELDRRERLVVLAGLAGTLVPLGVTLATEQLLEVPGHGTLVRFVADGGVLAMVFVVTVLLRSTLALPGARAYERKARELDAVYDFGLTARSAFDPERLEGAVLDALFVVGEPDVALMVVPDPGGDGCRCVLQRDDGDGRHRYRFGSRCRWQRLSDHFSDRRPLLVVDHQKAQPGVLEKIWEPATGSSAILPVIGQESTLLGVLIAGRFERHAFSSSDVRSLAGFASQVALALDHARLLRETVEAERRKRELEIARDFQLNLLPSEPPTMAGLDIADRSEPASEVGGDYFDYLPLEDGRLAVVVGDVAGHGMPAGLLMAMAKSAIHTQVQVQADPARLMGRLSETLLRMSADNQFMTMVFTELDLARGTLRYSNCGHHYPLLYRSRTETFEELESTGLPLGMLPRPSGPFRTREIEPGDILVFYTDGVTEAGSDADEDDMFGVERLCRVVLANRDRPAQTVVEAVFRAVRRHSGARPLADDATLVVVRLLRPAIDSAAAVETASGVAADEQRAEPGPQED